MNRRDFFQLTAGALLAGGTRATRPPLNAQSATSVAQSSGGRLVKVDIYSRHLQWLRTADEVAEAATEMGFDGVNVTVRPYPGHVDPDNLLFSRGRMSEVREAAPKLFETIKTLDDKCAEIYRRHPFYNPPDLRQVLRQLIQSPT